MSRFQPRSFSRYFSVVPLKGSYLITREDYLSHNICLLHSPPPPNKRHKDFKDRAYTALTLLKTASSKSIRHSTVTAGLEEIKKEKRSNSPIKQSFGRKAADKLRQVRSVPFTKEQKDASRNAVCGTYLKD